MILFDLKSLISSDLLSFKDLFYLHFALHKEWKTIDFILNCKPQKCGGGRYLQWKHSLFDNPQNNLSDDLKYYNSILTPNIISASLPTSETIRSGTGMGEIMRDVVRTYQSSPFFQEGEYGRDMLQHVLCALVKARPDVGYCQGMNFVVGAVIVGRLNPHVTHMALAPPVDKDVSVDANEDEDDEESASKLKFKHVHLTEEYMNKIESEVFHLMLQLFDKKNKLAMNGLWADRVPKLKLRVYQLDRLLKWNYPRLHDHFDQLKLSPEVLTAQWFVTLFAYNLPLYTTLHLWDYLFETGWEGVFKVAISLLGAMEAQFLALEDLEGFAMLMREWKRLGHLNINMTVSELLNKAHRLVINEEVLTRLQECFGSEILSLAVYCRREQILTGVHTGGNTVGGSRDTGTQSVSNKSNTGSNGSNIMGNTVGSTKTNSVYNNLTTGKLSANNSASSSPVVTTQNSNANSQKNKNDKSLSVGQGKYLNIALKTAANLYNNQFNSVSSHNKERMSTGSAESTDSNHTATTHKLSIDTQISTASTISVDSVPSSPVPITPPAHYLESHHDSAHGEEGEGSGNGVNGEGGGHDHDLEDEDDEKIQLGVELPTYWLLRYGNKLNLQEIDELISYKTELRRLDRLVDVDKATLHSKIIKSCDYHRETQEELEKAQTENDMWDKAVETLSADFQNALMHAQDLAEAVAKLMDVYHVKQSTPSVSAKDTKEMSGIGGVNNFISSPAPSGKNRSGSVSGNGGGVGVTFASTFSALSGTGGSSQGLSSGHKRHSLNSLVRDNGLLSTTTIDDTSSNGRTTVGNSLSGKSPSVSSNGNGSSSTRRYSLRAAIFNTVKNNNNAESNTENQSQNGREDGNEKTFLFSRMRNAIRLPSTMSNNYNVSANRNSNTNTSQHNLSPSVFVTPKKSANGMQSGMQSSEDICSPNNSSDNDLSELDRNLTVKNHNLSDLLDIVITSDSLVGLDIDGDNEEEGNQIENINNEKVEESSEKGVEEAVPLSSGRPLDTINESSALPVVETTDMPSSSLVSQSLSSTVTNSRNSSRQSLSTSTVVDESTDRGSERGSLSGSSVSGQYSNSNSSRMSDGVAGSGGIARQLRHLEIQSQHSQQAIIEIHRSLQDAKNALIKNTRRLTMATVNDDEAMFWKKSLCDQLQLLVEDSNKNRTQKLIFISENYLL